MYCGMLEVSPSPFLYVLQSQTHSYGTDPHAASRGLPTMQAYVERPTVVAGHFDPAGDAQTLRKAMKGKKEKL